MPFPRAVPGVAPQTLAGALGGLAGPRPHSHDSDCQNFRSLGYQGLGRHNPISENSTSQVSGLNPKDHIPSPVQNPPRFPTDYKGLPAMSFLRISTGER